MWGNPETEALFKKVAKARSAGVEDIHFLVADDPNGGPSTRIYPKDRLPKNFFTVYSNLHVYLWSGTVAQYAPAPAT